MIVFISLNGARVAWQDNRTSATALGPSTQTCNSMLPPRGGRMLLRSQPVPSFVSQPRGAVQLISLLISLLPGKRLKNANTVWWVEVLQPKDAGVFEFDVRLFDIVRWTGLAGEVLRLGGAPLPKRSRAFSSS